MTGGPDGSRHPKNASADRRATLKLVAPPSRDLGFMSVGVFFPRRWRDRASDTPVASPRFHLPPLPPSRELQPGRTSLCLYGSESAERAKTTVDAVPWRATPRDDPECLPSIGTLHRIRWPLQPRSHDPHTALDDGWTAGWRSLATLSLAPILARLAVSSTRDVPFARRARRRFHPPTFAPS